MNCIIRRPTDGKLIGYNTDYVGAISAIEDGLRGSCHLQWLTNVQSLLLVTVILKMLCACASIISWPGNHNGSSTTVSPLAGKLFVVIGAGGAGKAVAYGAKEKGARVVIANRTYGKLHDLLFSFLKLKRVKLSKLLLGCF